MSSERQQEPDLTGHLKDLVAFAHTLASILRGGRPLEGLVRTSDRT